MSKSVITGDLAQVPKENEIAFTWLKPTAKSNTATKKFLNIFKYYSLFC